MVLAKLYTNRVREEAHVQGHEEGRREGRQEGVAIGRQEMLTRWRDWNARRQQAEQAGQPFTEPEPGLDIETETGNTRK